MYKRQIICSALGGIAVNARQTRASMLGVFREDYITTARAKGQHEKMVVLKHMPVSYTHLQGGCDGYAGRGAQKEERP